MRGKENNMRRSEREAEGVYQDNSFNKKRKTELQKSKEMTVSPSLLQEHARRCWRVLTLLHHFQLCALLTMTEVSRMGEVDN